MFLVNRKQNDEFTSWVVMEDLDFVEDYAHKYLKADPNFMKFKLDTVGIPKTIGELTALENDETVTGVSYAIKKKLITKAKTLNTGFFNHIEDVKQYREQGIEVCFASRYKTDGNGKPLMIRVRVPNSTDVMMLPDEVEDLIPYETIKQLYPNVEKFFVNKGIRPFLPGRSSPGIRGFMTRNAHLQPAHPAEIMNAPQQPAPSPQPAVATQPAVAPLPPAAPQPAVVQEPPSNFKKLPPTMKGLSVLLKKKTCSKYDFGVFQITMMPCNKTPTVDYANDIANKMTLLAVARALVAREFDVHFSTDEIVASIIEDWNKYRHLSAYRAVLPEIPRLKHSVEWFIVKDVPSNLKTMEKYAGKPWNISALIFYMTHVFHMRLSKNRTTASGNKSSLEAMGKFSDGVFEYDGKLTAAQRMWLSRNKIKAVKRHA